MKNLPLYIVDVFAEQKYAGNQLAVVLDSARTLSSEDMQRIALEMNYSETTFILSDKPVNGGYDVRIFTPGEEVPFAGHPTLGTAFVVHQEIIAKPVENLLLNLKVGQIPVNIDPDTGNMLWMQQIAPTFGETLDPQRIADILGLTSEELDDRFPIEEVSTGLPFIIVPIKTLASLQHINLQRDMYFEFVAERWAQAILVFCPEPHEVRNAREPGNTLSARMFADCFGIIEDPATGSANGCLAGYLVKHRYFGQAQIDIRVEQGYEIKRPSLLYLKAEETDEKIDIFVGGKVVYIAKGQLV
jgi:trans-2,3-dihydro-3-hydroxyanthranilate isomerase